MPRNLLKKSIQIICPSVPPEDWVCYQYRSGKSCNQISEEIKSKSGVSITPKGIAYFVKKRGLMRTQRQSFINAIKNGRMSYQRPYMASQSTSKD